MLKRVLPYRISFGIIPMLPQLCLPYNRFSVKYASMKYVSLYSFFEKLKLDLNIVWSKRIIQNYATADTRKLYHSEKYRLLE